ncbi:MAG: hypothetical protein N2171_04875 [Clostridia bacterium]|nr:hypothetical protein [Clostridia bacterium]
MINSIIDGISIALNGEFGDGYEIYKETVNQDLTEPCFFIMLLSANQKLIMDKRYLKEHHFDIHYFPSTQDKNTEILDVVDRLYDVLEYITFGDSSLRGTNMSHEVVDGVLHFDVSYNFYVRKTTNVVDEMDTLEVNQKTEG